MKIAIIHSRYGSESPSGENIAVEADITQLEGNGIEVVRLVEEVERGGIGQMVMAAMSATWNVRSAMRIRAQLREHRPDLVHVHNVFPFLSPSVIWAAKRAGYPVVMTLHNYRLICANGLLLRDGKACDLCIVRQNAIAAVTHKCYRNSRVASAAVALSIEAHRAVDSWTRAVDGLIVFSEFQADMIRRSGITDAPIFIKPNMMPEEVDPVPWNQRDDQVVFIGRVGDEKGIRPLVQAWKQLGADAPPLCVVGSGPLEEWMRGELEGGPTSVEFTGMIETSAAQKVLASSKLLILPSICYEGYPLVVREAFAFGVPVLASDHGPMPDILSVLGSEFLSPPGDAMTLAARVRAIWMRKDLLRQASERMRAEYEERLRPRSNLNGLLHIYRETINRTARTRTTEMGQHH